MLVKGAHDGVWLSSSIMTHSCTTEKSETKLQIYCRLITIKWHTYLMLSPGFEENVAAHTCDAICSTHKVIDTLDMIVWTWPNIEHVLLSIANRNKLKWPSCGILKACIHIPHICTQFCCIFLVEFISQQSASKHVFWWYFRCPRVQAHQLASGSFRNVMNMHGWGYMTGY